jgi:hypothetical protein
MRHAKEALQDLIESAQIELELAKTVGEVAYHTERIRDLEDAWFVITKHEETRQACPTKSSSSSRPGPAKTRRNG